MVDNQYIYAVARIRTKEMALLDKLTMDQLIACKNYSECLRLLTDKGWGRIGNETAEELLTVEKEKTWEVINELVKDNSVFHTFLITNDFHNLKAAIKLVYLNEEVPKIFVTYGTIPVDLILQSVKEHDFSLLPEYMRQSANDAYEVLFHTGDSGLCECILDRASLTATYESGKKSQNEVLFKYAELKVAAANINIVIRGVKTGKERDFFERALADCDSLNKGKLIDAALLGLDEIYGYLYNTDYAMAVDAIKESPSSFECWCDNQIIELIKPQKYNSFTISPLAAYILARENEIKSVRIILSGKLNGLADSTVRERLREMYV
jgi:V/A-type H+/Na+-transporting ATPase subunit C